LNSDNFGSYDTGLKTNPYQYYFYSDNGYRTIIKSKVDLWNFKKKVLTTLIKKVLKTELILSNILVFLERHNYYGLEKLTGKSTKN